MRLSQNYSTTEMPELRKTSAQSNVFIINDILFSVFLILFSVASVVIFLNS
jgi:hypothetical protein